MQKLLLLVIAPAAALVTWTVMTTDERAPRPRAPHSLLDEIAPKHTDGDVSSETDSPTADDAPSSPQASLSRSPKTVLATHWVVDVDEKPIVGARVSVGERDEDDEGPLGFASTDRLTGADGSVTLPMTARHALWITAEGYAERVVWSPALSSRRNSATYVVMPAPILRVRMIDGAGRPVGGATIRNLERRWSKSPMGNGFGQRSQHDTATSDVQGLADWAFGDAVRYSIADERILARRGRLVSVPRRVYQGLRELTLVLGPAASVHGRVSPRVAGCGVSVAGLANPVETDRHGRFEITGLWPGPHTLQASLEGDRELNATLTLNLFAGEQRKNADLQLLPDPISFLAIRVEASDGSRATDVEAELGKPQVPSRIRPKPVAQDGLVLRFQLPPGSDVGITWPFRATLRTTRSPESVQLVRVGKAVHFIVRCATMPEIQSALHVRGDRWVHRKRPETLLAWSAFDGSRFGSGVIPAPREGELIELGLAPIPVLRGRLVTEAGGPARGFIDGLTTVDETGRFEVRVRPDQTHLTVTDRPSFLGPLVHDISFPPLRSDESRDLGEIVVPDLVTIRGYVADANGRPAGGVRIMIDNASAFSPVRSLPDGRFVAQVRGDSRVIAFAKHPNGHVGIASGTPLHITLGPAAVLNVKESVTAWEHGELRSVDGRLTRGLSPGTQLRLPPGDYILARYGKEIRQHRIKLRAGETTTLSE